MTEFTSRASMSGAMCLGLVARLLMLLLAGIAGMTAILAGVLSRFALAVRSPRLGLLQAAIFTFVAARSQAMAFTVYV